MVQFTILCTPLGLIISCVNGGYCGYYCRYVNFNFNGMMKFKFFDNPKLAKKIIIGKN